MAVLSAAYASEMLAGAKELRPRGTLSRGTGAPPVLRQVYGKVQCLKERQGGLERASEGARQGKREEGLQKEEVSCQFSEIRGNT